jgi:2-dehydro-3-deoxyphosphogalactonate aldolase
VGGANPDNFAEYFSAGCTGFGIGSYLYKPGATLADIAARASATVAAYDRALQRPPG